VAQEHYRLLDFERIAEKEDARCALVASQNKHQEELKTVQVGVGRCLSVCVCL
jgi:hypothetical protein